MRKYLFFSVPVFLCVIAAGWLVLAKMEPYEKGQEYMSLADAQKHWPQKPFSVDGFKKGVLHDRASMVVDLIKSGRFIGKTAQEVRNTLGDYTGYFFSDRIPAYLVEEGWQTKGDTWQVVFLLNLEGKIKEVKIHKNCCEKASP
jgi:hypothetical protein